MVRNLRHSKDYDFHCTIIFFVFLNHTCIILTNIKPLYNFKLPHIKIVVFLFYCISLHLSWLILNGLQSCCCLALCGLIIRQILQDFMASSHCLGENGHANLSYPERQVTTTNCLNSYRKN